MRNPSIACAAPLLLAASFAAASSDDQGLDFSRVFKDAREAFGTSIIKGGKPEPPQPPPPPVRIISWNVRTFGGGIKPERAAAFGTILGHMFSDSRSAKVLAIQEVANEKGADKFDKMLPGRDSRWNPVFDNTADSQDNAIYTRKGVVVDCEKLLFKEGSLKSLHPARAAHVRVDDLDFTIVTMHLTFKDADATRRELRHALNWLKDYLADPSNDPDVILAGDYNLPTRRGKEASKRSRESRWFPLEDVIETYPGFRRGSDAAGRRQAKPSELIALVDDLTSRSKGAPANNYDHFIITGDLFDEEYVEGSAGVVPPHYIDSVEAQAGVVVSDHYPISARFLAGGTGKDGRAILPDGPGHFCQPP